jgi:cysteine desulfurase / selenocysteine lyase
MFPQEQVPQHRFDAGSSDLLGGREMTTAARSPQIHPGAPSNLEGASAQAFDVQRVRRDFPILQTSVRGKPLVYLDNAATSQKPTPVIEAMRRYYESGNANIHRGVHYLSEHATEEHEAARETARAFINAAHAHELIFVRGTTEGINLVAQTYGRANVRSGDEVLITAMEHHSNIVPWQILCEERGAKLRVAPINDAGELVLEEFAQLLNSRTKIAALTHVSNALGTINPLKQIVELAHGHKVPVLVDGAQAIPHIPVDVQELGVDFYVFSGHKVYGPTGIGLLYGKSAFLESMPPYQGGGDMISSVTFEKTLYNKLPFKFEAGTPHVAGAIGLAVALDYVTSLGLANIAVYEHGVLDYAIKSVGSIPGVRLVGTAKDKTGVLSFTMEGIHPHDIGTILDREGIAVRTGHHCAQPIMQRFGIPATARASFALYNTRQEVDALVAGIHKVREVFA